MADRENLQEKKIRELGLSLKVDLLIHEIPLVAHYLIRDHAVSVFLNQFTLVYNIWTCSLITGTSITDSIVAAFDAVRFPRFPPQRTRESYLFSRFTYIHLINIVDALKNSVAVHRLPGSIGGRPSASIPLDVYLEAKGLPIDNQKLRNRLSKYTTIGRRWSELAGPSPFWLALYSKHAETIMCVSSLILLFLDLNLHSQNNSKKLETLTSLAAQVQSDCPEVVQVLDCLKYNETLAIMSGESLNIQQIEDIISKTRKH